MAEIKLREYQQTDKSALIHILRKNIPEFFDENEAKDFENYLECHLEVYFVAELAGVLVGGGGINFADDGRTAKISWDFIDPQYQGRGVGKALLRFRLDYLKKMLQITEVTVRTSQFAYGFYEKHGFALEQIVRDYWAPGYDLYYMRYCPA